MTLPNQGLFEAPTSYEANQYGNQEMEYEWENSNQEFENEWENQEATAGSQYEFENEWENQEATAGSNYEFENEWESPQALSQEFENEWESNAEWEDEGELFFGKKFFKKIAKKGLKTIGKAVAPIAKKMAPIVAGKLVSLIPGGGVLAPHVSKLTSSMLQEGEMEAVQMEMEFFGENEGELEVASTEAAYEAALTEFLGSQAAEAESEAEAAAALGAALPISIQIFSGKRALLPVTPILAQANSQLVKSLRQQGASGRELLRLVPKIQRQTVATLKAASRAGKPINGPLAIQSMASATHRVLSNPRTVQQSVERNVALRQRTAPPTPRRMGSQPMNGNCPNCGKTNRHIR